MVKSHALILPVTLYGFSVLTTFTQGFVSFYNCNLRFNKKENGTENVLPNRTAQQQKSDSPLVRTLYTLPLLTVKTQKFSTHWTMLPSPQWGSIWSGSRSREKHRKVERDESVGNVTAVVPLPAPAAGAVSKNTQKPTVAAQSRRYVQDNNCESHCHLDFTLITKGKLSFCCYTYAVNSAVGYRLGCVLLTKLTVMVSLGEQLCG